ncbi:hypothetical protein [Thermosphaera sp.]
MKQAWTAIFAFLLIVGHSRIARSEWAIMAVREAERHAVISCMVEATPAVSRLLHTVDTEDGETVMRWRWLENCGFFTLRSVEMVHPKSLHVSLDGNGKAQSVLVEWYGQMGSPWMTEPPALAFLIAFGLVGGEQVHLQTTADGWNVSRIAIDLGKIELVERDEKGGERRSTGFSHVLKLMDNARKRSRWDGLEVGPLYVSSRCEDDKELQKCELFSAAVARNISVWRFLQDGRLKRVILTAEGNVHNFLEPVRISACGTPPGSYIDLRVTGYERGKFDLALSAAMSRWAKRCAVDKDVFFTGSATVALDAPIYWEVLCTMDAKGIEFKGIAEDRRVTGEDMGILEWVERDIQIRWDVGIQSVALPVGLKVEHEDQRGQRGRTVPGRFRVKRVTVTVAKDAPLRQRSDGVWVMRMALLWLWASDNQIISGTEQHTYGPGASVTARIDYSRTVFALTNGTAIWGYTLNDLFPDHSQGGRLSLKWAGALLPKESANELLGEVLPVRAGVKEYRFVQRGDYWAPRGREVWIPPESFELVSTCDKETGEKSEHSLILRGRRIRPSTLDYQRAIVKYWEEQ